LSTPLPVGPLSPYITPSLLTQASTGISWGSIPAGKDVSEGQRIAEQANICARATALVDEAVSQPLRATIDTLVLYGPGVRVGAPQNGCLEPARLILKRWPVLEVISVQVAQNTFPVVWSTVPPGNYAPANPVSGLYGSIAPTAAAEGGQAILVSSQYVNWAFGRNGYAIEVAYVNGWPHTSLTASATPATPPAAQTISVDDCTGWAITAAVGGTTGATGTVYDAGSQEVIQVTAASATQGPGTLTLAAPLQNTHAAGTMISTLPQSVVWAAILFCCSQALTRGATSTTILQAPGGKSDGGSMRATTLAKQACDILAPYKRVI
jgi:hypothetical protein